MDGDFLLILRMRAGDEAAVERFVREHYPAILRYCRLRAPGLAEDAAQETFARFFASFDRYRHCGRARNYLYAVAGNVCRDLARRNRELPVAEVPLPPCEDAGAELRVDLGRALDSLPPELREVALLYFAQGLRQREVARILGVGLPLVKYRVRRARERLMELLKEE